MNPHTECTCASPPRVGRRLALWQLARSAHSSTGNIAHELVVLNHEALWLRTPRPAIPDVSAYLPRCRQLLAEGKYRQAESFLGDQLIRAWVSFTPASTHFHPAFDIAVDMGHEVSIQPLPPISRLCYWRRWWSPAGAAHLGTRAPSFVSRVDDIVVMRICAEAGAVR